MKFAIIENLKPKQILIEENAFEGVLKIAQTVSKDIENVCGQKADIIRDVNDLNTNGIIAATIGKSSILDVLEKENVLDLNIIRGKKEVFLITEIDPSKIKGVKVADQNALQGEKILIIAGSDKRGTIYGLFEISQACGVTSLEYMGDCTPVKRSDILMDDGFFKKDRAIKKVNENVFVSKEPSVEYRGFFINDEWPAFGGWCNAHFNGFTSEAYEKLFIFLLRMRGNFLWPAMWSSIFSEDGPSTKSAELADCLGVIMGTSHHEPLCRAGEEWQKIYKEYGESNAWNFLGNREAITEFWRDGLKRNKNFENLITIGMRGEADSKLLGEDATMEDNINVVKEAILTQNELLKEIVNEDLSEIPRVLAIYKEVEDYYYGDGTCEGLKDWDVLKDVIFLLSDDNWANTRGLPTEEERKHPGGFGMYYHFDYHGGPISYEWQNTSRLSKTWEQMTQAYEYGVRKEWIVNVGDLKGNEYPLTYFMALAYDYETWSKPDMIDTFMDEWINEHFHARIEGSIKDDLLEYIEGATALVALRKPEALNPYIYSAENFGECERMSQKVSKILELGEKLRNSIPLDCKEAFESLFYYQIKGSLNILMMQLEAALNIYLAGLRSLYANVYAQRIKERTLFMGDLVKEYNAFKGGKWVHMLDSGHTGFNTWDDYDWGYPASIYVNPIHKGKMVLHFADTPQKFLGEHWQYKDPLINCGLLDGNVDKVSVYLDSRGDVDFNYKVECNKEWLKCDNCEGTVITDKDPRAVLVFTCDKTKLEKKEEAEVSVKIDFSDGSKTCAALLFEAAGIPSGKKGIFFENDGVISIEAQHYNENSEGESENGWKEIKYLGRQNPALKCYPVTKDHCNDGNSPYVRYDVMAAGGKYILEADVLARNPVVLGEDMILYVSANDDKKIALNAVKSDFYAGHTCPQWCDGVLDNVRRITCEIDLKEGENSIYVHAASPNVSFDKIMLFNADKGVKDSYLGAPESYRG